MFCASNEEHVVFMDRMAKLKLVANNMISHKQYTDACAAYGKVIEEIMQTENDVTPCAHESACLPMDSTQLVLLKASLFLNIAAANLQLNQYEGCRRCCNAGIVVLNRPEMLLSEMGMEDDLTLDVPVCEPVSPVLMPLMTKALYRRGKCCLEMFTSIHINVLNALKDKKVSNKDHDITDNSLLRDAISSLQQGIELFPKETSIRDELKKCLYLQKLTGVQVDPVIAVDKKTTVPTVPPRSLPTKTINDIACFEDGKHQKPVVSVLNSMMVNGGLTLGREAYWAQSVYSVELSIPLMYLTRLDSQTHDTKHPQAPSAASDDQHKHSYMVTFNAKEIVISYEDRESPLLTIDLSHPICPHMCYWSVEYYQQQYDGRNSEERFTTVNTGYIVCYLTKAIDYSCGRNAEEVCGQEWWDCVTLADDRIETTTCNANHCTSSGDTDAYAGTCHSPFPTHSHTRAHKEYHRFSQLSQEEQRCELLELAKVKQSFHLSAVSVSDAVDREDKAIELVPERAEMLHSLRQEFPSIDFTAK